MQTTLKPTIVFLTFLFITTLTSFNVLNAQEEKFVVVLDAGHGGNDPGNTGNGHKEKHIALEITLEVGRELEKNPDITCYNCSNGAKVNGTYPLRSSEIMLESTSLTKDEVLGVIKNDAFVSSDENKDSKMKFRRREFNFSTFKKSFHLSDQINKEKINAAYENGVLRITLDKKEEAKEKEPRTISIH